jgi:hypothetical protein
MNNYSFNITLPVLWITSWNSKSKCVKKAKSDVVSNFVSQKFDVDIAILQYDLFVLWFNLFVPIVL